MARLPTLCQVNYDRDLPPSPRLRASTSNRSNQLSPNVGCSPPRLLAYSRHRNDNNTDNLTDVTPYRYCSSASFPPPWRECHQSGQSTQNHLSRSVADNTCSRWSHTTPQMSYPIPVGLPHSQGSSIETSHTVNAEHLNEPRWNQFLNAWVAEKTDGHHAYFKIACPMNLNSRGVFHSVRDFDPLPQLPCERFEGHKHQFTFRKFLPEKPKKILQKPEYWQWKGRTEPNIPRLHKSRQPVEGCINFSPPCSSALSTHRATSYLAIPASASPLIASHENSCQSDTSVFSAPSLFSEFSSLSLFPSTSTAVSLTESKASHNSTTTSGIQSCESSINTTDTAPTNLFYLPAAPRVPSVVPWEGEDGWGSDISSFHSEPAIIPWMVDDKVKTCRVMVIQPLALEQVKVLSDASLNACSICEVLSEQMVPPNVLVNRDMIRIDGLDRVTIQTPSLHSLPELPQTAPLRVSTTTNVRLSSKTQLQPKRSLPPQETQKPPRKNKEIVKKQKATKRKQGKKPDVSKSTTPILDRLPTPVESCTNTQEEEESVQIASPIPARVSILLPPLPIIKDDVYVRVKTKPPPPKLISVQRSLTPTRIPTPPPKTPSLSPEPRQPEPQSYGVPDLDPSVGMELERQRRADERRRKALLMFENLKKRKGIRIKSPQSSISIMDTGWLAQFCIIKRAKQETYRRAFDAADEDKDGFLSCQEMLYALKGVVSTNSLSDAEQEYIYRVLEMADYTVLNGANFKLFAVVAALTQKITSIDTWMKNLIQRVDFKMLDMKMFRAKELFLWNVDEATNQLSIERLMIELKAGGVSQEHQDEVQIKLGHLEALDVLDFLTYLPLFLLMHSSVVKNPFDLTRDK